MSDSNPAATFGYVARQARKRGLAFLCVREAITGMRFGPQLREIFGGVYIANEGLTKRSAEQLLATGEADAAAFGRLFIANPDLPRRFLLDAPLADANPDLYYTQGATGYIDYPALPQ
jgi:2,4-dienoyl-CoA reductase-like NADH-dependent reductase (Old Yellow Enzyme family)